MRREDVFTALRQLGISESEVWIDDVHEPDPPPPEFLFLRQNGSNWEIGISERGQWDVLATFTEESAACEQLLRLAAPTR